MALGTDMKSLVEDILASRDARVKTLSDIRKDTYHIIAGAKTMLKDFAKASGERAGEVKKLAREVKSFLKSSGENRKHDFQATMKTARASLEDVRKDSKRARNTGKTIIKEARALLTSIAKDNEEGARELRASLKKGEGRRKTDFKAMMGDIQEDLKEVKGDVSEVRKDSQDMVSRYHHSRMSAQKHWALLSKGKKNRKSEE
jgi:ElaB/YqjD/DUF883 family membrane-anchored ribosome-binding protein